MDTSSLISLLEAAFPAHRTDGLAVQIREAGLDSDVARKFLTNDDWREVTFPDENDFILEAFGLLDSRSQLFYLPTYAVNALGNNYYLSGFLFWAERLLTPDSSSTSMNQLSLLSRMQIESFLRVLEAIRDNRREMDYSRDEAKQLCASLLQGLSV